MFLKSVLCHTLMFWVAYLAAGSLVFGDDEPKPTPTPTNEQQAVLDADPFIKKIAIAFDTELRSAETVFLAAKQKAEAKRLASYRDQLKAFTMAGDFDKASACKSTIDLLEATGLEGLQPRPKDAAKFGGHSYAVVKDAATWHVAKRRCEMMGGHLAYVKGAKELDFIAKLAGRNIVFLGATDEESEGQWRWLDGSKWVPKNWETDNAKGFQHALSWDGSRRVLDDTYSGDRLSYICEWDK